MEETLFPAAGDPAVPLETDGTLRPAGVAAFRRAIRSYYRRHRRPMAWRETTDPYLILVSEVMLQQTQVDRVRTKYAEFTDAFPTLRSLAEAPVAEVVRRWQGLGYNRRAIYLRECAATILAGHGGRLPRTEKELAALPGIGPATAASIRAFAFNAPSVFIETNIRRVFIHFFFRGAGRVSDREILPLVERTLDRGNPREWYYALMDYGAMLPRLTPNPNRKSAHYQRQSPFEGSSRQLRGALLRLVAAEPGIAVRAAARRLGRTGAEIRPALERLAAEGFLAETRGRYALKR